MTEKPTEESLFTALYWSQYRQGAGVARHASVGEPHHTWLAAASERADHSVRRIDALVIRRNLRGGDTLWAVEIKTSASDLRREIANPDKTAAWARYVHAFYFLVPPALLEIALAEVPKQYGVMLGPEPDRYYGFAEIKRRATKNPDPDPLPLDTWRRLAGKLGEHQVEQIARARRQAAERDRLLDDLQTHGYPDA